MRILRVRRGFQADHSSSSYLFYAVDRKVSEEGRAIAHRYSSRAEVHGRTVRYQKWSGDLNPSAYEALLGAHYDVMASESYDWWTLMIALPKTPATRAMLAPFADRRGENDQGVDVEEYGDRLAVTVFCAFDGNGVEFADASDEGDALEGVVDLLVKVRAEILEGDTSFLDAVASFYGAWEDEEEDESDEDAPSPESTAALDDLSKADLQERCDARGIDYRKSWTKAQLREALAAKASRPPRPGPKGHKPRLTRAGKAIVSQLVNV